MATNYTSPVLFYYTGKDKKNKPINIPVNISSEIKYGDLTLTPFLSNGLATSVVYGESGNQFTGYRMMSKDPNDTNIYMLQNSGKILKITPSGKKLSKEDMKNKILPTNLQAVGEISVIGYPTQNPIEQKTGKGNVKTGTTKIEVPLSELPDEYKRLRMAMVQGENPNVQINAPQGTDSGSSFLGAVLKGFGEGALNVAGKKLSSVVGQQEFDEKIVPQLEQTYNTKFGRRPKEEALKGDLTKAQDEQKQAQTSLEIAKNIYKFKDIQKRMQDIVVKMASTKDENQRTNLTNQYNQLHDELVAQGKVVGDKDATVFAGSQLDVNAQRMGQEDINKAQTGVSEAEKYLQLRGQNIGKIQGQLASPTDNPIEFAPAGTSFTPQEQSALKMAQAMADLKLEMEKSGLSVQEAWLKIQQKYQSPSGTSDFGNQVMNAIGTMIASQQANTATSPAK